MVQPTNMKYYLQLVRPVNLVVLTLTMLLFRYCIIDAESYALYDFVPYLKDSAFYILLATTILVAAGGYVINDIFDIETDRVNRPDRLIVGQHIDEKKAFNFYFGLTIAGVAGSFLLMYLTKNIKVSSIPMITIILLYLYATTFKKMTLMGNVVIALCSALPIILLSIYELRINQFDTAVIILFTQGIGLAAMVYATFAFMTTLIREIIKDVEDMKGDDAIDARTFPVIAGINASKALILILQFITLFLIGLIGYYLLAFKLAIPFYGYVLCLLLPLLVQIALVIQARQPEQFRWASTAGKVHMFLGVLTMLYFYNGLAPYFFNQLFNYIAQLFNFIR